MNVGYSFITILHLLYQPSRFGAVKLLKYCDWFLILWVSFGTFLNNIKNNRYGKTGICNINI